MRSTLHLVQISAMSLLACCLAAVPGHATLYTLLTTIAVPSSPDNNTPNDGFDTFDISFFDPVTGLDYVADRSNASVDIFSGASNTFVGRIGGTGHLFSGQQATNPMSGPDGVLVTNLPGQHDVWAGNGNSTLLGFNIDAAYAPLPGTPIATGPASDLRVDEMSFDPRDNRLVVANNAASPYPFFTVINTSNNTIVAKTTLDGTNGTPVATNGIEQSVWDPVSKKFYLSVPQIGGSGPGGIAEIDPLTGAILHTYSLASFGIGSCSPAGLVKGAGSLLMIGCSNAGTQTILFNPQANHGNGAIVKLFPQVSGSDELWYDPKDGTYFVAADTNLSGPVLGVIEGLNWIENVPTSPGAHSVAVDPLNGEVFVPLGGIAGNTTCPSGCVAVFAPTHIPEPGSLPLSLVGLAGLVFLRRQLVARHRSGL